MSDPLIDAIRANPHDDATRLVWADREGGERGELVVVQCALAKGNVPREQLGKLIRREIELKKKLATDGLGFVRGFVEHAPVSFAELRDPAALLSKYPLLKSVRLTEVSLEGSDAYPPPSSDSVLRDVEALPALDPIERIEASPNIDIDGNFPTQSSYGDTFAAALGKSKAAPTLKGLRIDQYVREIAVLAPFPALEDLWFTCSGPLAALFDQHPRLKRLRIHTEYGFDRKVLEPLFAHPAAAGLEELDITGSVAAIAHAPNLKNLRRLRLGPQRFPLGEIRDLAAAQHLASLTELSLAGSDYQSDLTDEVVELLTHATFAPTLKRLALDTAATTEAVAPLLLAFPALERVALMPNYGRDFDRAQLQSIPFVTH